MTMTMEAGRAGTSRKPVPIGGVTAHMLEVLRRSGADMSQLGIRAETEEHRAEWTDVAVPQADARHMAWVNSVRTACHDDYLKWRLDDLDADQHPRDLRNWLSAIAQAKQQGARPAYRNLIVAGTIGSGKTTGLMAMGNEAAERGLMARFAKHSTYLAWLRPEGAPDGLTAHQIRRRHTECDLLILDELCGDMDDVAAEFVRRETTDLVDARGAAGRATAFTTNLDRQGIGRVLGPRLVSRLEARAYLVKMDGPDRRAPRKALDW